ncbi:MAG: hypothetical protein ACP5JJ_02680 [Anaerolineae bacterium]
MECPDCGAYVGEEDQFCGECGRPIQHPAPASEPLTPEAVKDAPAEPAARARPAPPAAPTLPALEGLLRRRTLLLVSAGVTVAVLLCACVAVLVIWVANRSTMAPAPTEASSAPGALLYEDDFEDPESGWDVYNDGDTLAIYSSGEYRLAVYEENYVTWANPEPALDLSDFLLEAEARQVEGALDNNLGLLVRYEDDEHFYWFQISSDGYFSVDLWEEGEWTSLVGWEASPAIQQGLDATNRLRLVCRGNEFEFYVNDSLLTTLVEGTYSTGNIGLAIGTFDEPGVVVHFDNVLVRALEE